MQLEKPDFVELLHLLAHSFKARATNHQFDVNPQFGKGYCWAEKLPSGMTILVSDTCLKENISIDRSEGEDHYFTLQFNEEAADDEEIPVKGKQNTAEFESFVKLSHTLIPETFVFPARKRLR